MAVEAAMERVCFCLRELRHSHELLSMVYELAQPGSMISGAEGFRKIHTSRKGKWDPKIIKISGNSLRRNELIY